MKDCARWKEAIADSALGKTPEPDLAAHLDICPRCANEFRESSAMAARIEEALHRVAAVEPPHYGPERVMARIDVQKDVRARWGWAWVSGAAALLMILMVVWQRRPAPEPDLTALSTWRSPTQALLRPPVAAAWTTRPRLGEGFFEIKPKGEKGEIRAQ